VEVQSGRRPVSTRDVLSKTSELRFAPTAGAPSQARVAVKATLSHRSKETIETACLLVSELVTNSLRHGKAILNASVVLRIAQHDQVIRIEVVDWGRGFDYHRRSEPLDHAGGWGLYLVEQLSSRWGIERGTPNVVWFELDESA
jgi:anti-sigma regulatory factor (Ser/Thr protein kinase)